MSNSRIPEPQFPYRHSIDVQVRFNDADIFGHLNNSVYLQFYDLAKVEYFRAVQGGELDIKGIAMVVVNINCDFYAPSFIHEKLQVQTTTLKVGKSSLVLEQRCINSETGDVKCLCRTVMAGFDPKTNTSCPVSDEWRSQLEAFEGRSFALAAK